MFVAAPHPDYPRKSPSFAIDFNILVKFALAPAAPKDSLGVTPLLPGGTADSGRGGQVSFTSKTNLIAKAANFRSRFSTGK